jgi:hypothetical protein
MRLLRSGVWLVWPVLGGCLFAQAPLTGPERVRIYAGEAYWSTGVFLNAVVPAITGQIADNPREWGEGVAGFSRRAASSFGRNALMQTYKAAAAAALKHEVRYVPVRNKSFLARTANALTSDLVTYDATGTRVPNVATIGGAIAAEYTANLWMPDRFRTASRTMRRAGFVLGFDGVTQLLREFSPELKGLNPFHRK